MANQAKQAIAAHAVCNMAYMAYPIGPLAAQHGCNGRAAANMAYIAYMAAFNV